MKLRILAIGTFLAVAAAPFARADDEFPDNDAILRALVDELDRSMNLQLEDLEKPYLIQFTVDDQVRHSLSATFGAITGDDRNHSRMFRSEVRVGSYELDNTNFQGGGAGGFGGRRGGGRRPGGGGGGAGGRTFLPVDDDYMALRKSIWLATDGDYKNAVETLTSKRAYMQDRNVGNRPDDYQKMEPTKSIEPRLELRADDERWKTYLRNVSALFLRYPFIQDSGATLETLVGNRYLVTSEGSRLRHGRTATLLRITAEVQADDGERFSDALSYVVSSPAELPAVAKLQEDIADLAAGLERAMKCAVLEGYTGPVLFDEVAAAQLFNALLARGVAAQPESVGGGRRRFRGAESLDRYLGREILPPEFRVYDDPRADAFGDQFLAGHYLFDDEGVPAQRVDIIEEGRLVGMAMSRTPTKKLSGTNGHGRAGRGGAPRASVGCLYIESTKGVPRAELEQALLQEAEAQGLPFAIRVTSLRGGGGGIDRQAMLRRFQRGQFGGGGGGMSPIGDPIHVYKVYVEDGRVEPVRGCEFGELNVRSLQGIIAAGERAVAYNPRGNPPTSIIAPPIILDEVDLARIQTERSKKPLLPAPHGR